MGFMREDQMVRVPEEIAVTTGGLIRVALLAAAAFATMAWMVDERSRPLTLVLGVLSIVAIAAVLVHLRWQRRYGTATLSAERPFEPGKPFAGTIVSELPQAPGSPIRIRISGWSARSEVTLSRTVVDPMHLRRAPDGSLVIPFHVPPPDEPIQWRPREVRLRVRTAHWPVGWGATFVISRNP
jgi:hypothetical protein